MNKLAKTLIALTFVTAGQAFANEDIFTYGDKAKNVHHVGDIWLQHLSNSDENFDYNVAVAKSAPRAVLNWHFHPKNQQLIIIDGKGYYQERGKDIQIVKKGDVIKCTPGLQHWHGASKEEGVTYIAISGNAKTEWFEAIDMAQYNAAEN